MISFGFELVNKRGNGGVVKAVSRNAANNRSIKSFADAVFNWLAASLAQAEVNESDWR